MSDISGKFQQDPSITFRVILPGFLPNHLQNSITCSFWHSGQSLKIAAKSVLNLLSYIARIPDFPGFLPDHPQNCIICSFGQARHLLKISQRSVNNLLSYIAMIPSGFSRISSASPQNWIICSFWHSRNSLKISARSVHNLFSYIARIPSGFARISSGSPPKLNHLWFLPCPTFTENFTKIRPQLFELSC